MLYIVKVFRIAFIGQNGVELGDQGQSDLFNIISGLVDAHDYIEFNSGYGNIFERTAADIAKNILLGRTDKFGAINLWLPYKTSEHIQNRKYYEAFFDRILFCSRKQKKSAHRKTPCDERVTAPPEPPAALPVLQSPPLPTLGTQILTFQTLK